VVCRVVKKIDCERKASAQDKSKVSSGSDLGPHVNCFSSHEDPFAKHCSFGTSFCSFRDPNSYYESSSSLIFEGEGERESLVLEGNFMKQSYGSKGKEIVTSSLETGLTTEFNQEISIFKSDDSMWGNG
jgi:hypothetical protein